MPPSASSLLNRFTLRAKFRHMQVLLTLAELGSMRKAAKHLNMTQPGISQMVAELERLVEVDLFLRHARGVSLTPAGAELVIPAKRILQTLGEAAERVTNEIQQKGGVVRISASPAALGAMFHGRLNAFVDQYPATQLQISQVNDENPLTDAQNNAPDIICLREPTVAPEGWVFVPCAADQLSVVCHGSHPLAALKEVHQHDLAKAVWLMHRTGSLAQNRLEASAAKNAWPALNLCHINSHIPALTNDILASGKYAALLPRSAMKPWIESHDLVEVHSPLNEALAPLGFLWQPDQARDGTRRVVTFLRSHANL